MALSASVGFRCIILKVKKDNVTLVSNVITSALVYSYQPFIRVSFEISPAVKIEQMLNEYCLKTELDPLDACFIFKGVEISFSKTSKELNLQDNDTIFCVSDEELLRLRRSLPHCQVCICNRALLLSFLHTYLSAPHVN